MTVTTASSESGPQRLRRWLPLAAVLVLSRALVLLGAALAETVLVRNPNLVSGAGGPLVTSLTTWDGWWYLSIVRTGYHVAPLVASYHDYAFLPGWPALVRLLSLPVAGWEGLIAVITANVLFLAGSVLLVRLTEPLFGWSIATRSAGLMALFPFSAAFSMAYAESLFLVLMLAAFLAAERRRPGWTGVFLALATLARLQGVVLLVPLAWVLWERSGRERPTMRWLPLLLGPAAAVGLIVWTIWLTGQPGAYGAAQGAWGRTGLGGDPTGSLGEALAGPLGVVHAINLAALLFAVFLFVFARTDRIPLPYLSIPVMFIAMTVVTGSIQSIGRLILPAFPNYWTLAKRKRWFGRVAWPVISGVLLVVVSALMFAGWLVP